MAEKTTDENKKVNVLYIKSKKQQYISNIINCQIFNGIKDNIVKMQNRQSALALYSLFLPVIFITGRNNEYKDNGWI